MERDYSDERPEVWVGEHFRLEVKAPGAVEGLLSAFPSSSGWSGLSAPAWGRVAAALVKAMRAERIPFRVVATVGNRLVAEETTGIYPDLPKPPPPPFNPILEIPHVVAGMVDAARMMRALNCRGPLKLKKKPSKKGKRSKR